MNDTPIHAARPLSPHLQIYRPLLTMMMSIAHRVTGAALYFSMPLLAWWLIAAASGPEYFAFVDGLLFSFFGIIILIGASWALIHHAIGGMRHFIWDLGYGFSAESRQRLAILTLAGSVGGTALLWLGACFIGG